jgi:hypothetical protein
VPSSVLLAAAGLAAQAPGGYTIAGTVANAVTGDPVRRAAVAVLAVSDSHTIASVESDADGHFALGGLPAAKYQLTASKRGFRTAFYDEHEEFSTAIVTGPGQETEGLSFRLVPGAVLHGLVAGDGGDPVEGAKVMLFQRIRQAPPGPGIGSRLVQVNWSTTDDTGAYDFDNLEAGEYWVAVEAEPWYAIHHSAAKERKGSGRDESANASAALDVAYPITFFDSTTDEASASRLVLAGGSRVEADINVHAVPALRLVVETPGRADGAFGRAELRETVFGSEISSKSMGFKDTLIQNGSVEFDGVAPGHYEVVQGEPARVAELDATTSQQVDPALGALTVQVSGQLRTAGGAALADEANVTLSPLDATRHQQTVVAHAIRGAFSFSEVLPGIWELWVESAGRLLAVESTTVGSRIHAGNRLAVRDHAVSLVATVNRGETRVEGIARKSGKGFAGAMVVLVPRDVAAWRALVRRDQSDSDGSFSLRDVVPGQYTVIALEDGWEMDWTNAEVLGRYLPRGVPVSVTSNSGKLVQLSLPVPVESR